MKIIILSLAILLYVANPAFGHGAPDTKREDLHFKQGCTYEIRYTPIGTDKMAIITFSSVGEIRMLGMREVLTGVTPEGDTFHLPVDLILDIREKKAAQPAAGKTPTEKEK